MTKVRNLKTKRVKINKSLKKSRISLSLRSSTLARRW